jgi:hypothetical protein
LTRNALTNILPRGEMAERSKAHDSKSCEVKSLRGFESHSLRKGFYSALF